MLISAACSLHLKRGWHREQESYCLTTSDVWMFIFLRMPPSRPRLQPHRPSLLLKTLPPPTRTLLLTSSWCRAVRWASRMLFTMIFFFNFCSFSSFFKLLLINNLDSLMFFFHIHIQHFSWAVQSHCEHPNCSFDDLKDCMIEGI